MKKLIVLAVVAIAAYFVFFQDSFHKELHFDGQTYSYVKTMRGGEATNHFYSPDGEPIETATSFIQIVELSENFQDKSEWLDNMNPLFTQYKLTPVGNQPLEVAGSFEKSGFVLGTYGAPISVNGTNHMAFYVVATNKEGTGEATTSAQDVINQLKGLGADLD
jgi:hypothetical protein